MPRMIARSWLCIGDFRSLTRSSPAPGSGVGASPRWTTSAGSPKELIRTARMHCPLQIEAGCPADNQRVVAYASPPNGSCGAGSCSDKSCAERFQVPEKTRGERLGPFATNDLIAAVASLLAMTGLTISRVVWSAAVTPSLAHV